MSSLIVLGVFVLGLYLLVRLGSRAVAYLAGARFKAYRRLAARYRGRYESRGLVDPPTVSFTHGRSSVRVGLAPTVPGQPSFPRTRVVSRFAQGLPFRMELMPAGRPAPPQPPKGTRPVRLGVPEFDRAFVVLANDPDIARALLEPPESRGAVEALRRLAPPSGMLVSVNPERMLVQVDRNLGAQPAWLEGAVREALRLHDRLLAGVEARLAVGIDIVAVGPADADGGGPPVCEVCGDPIVGPHVVCTACRTPCCRDCWTFVGGCSTFGCPSKQCQPA